MRRRSHGRSGRWLLVVGAVAVAACGASERRAPPNLTGRSVEVLAVWRDAEAAAFQRVLTAFEERTGASVTYVSAGTEAIATVLRRRLAAGDPPDVALVPQPGLITELATAGALRAIDDPVAAQVRAHWAPVWHELGTVDGELYGLWFKASHKSLIWYSIAAFESAGVVPPVDLDGFAAVVAALSIAGPPLSVTAATADAWTLTDWFENLYLRLAGPDAYDALTQRRRPWTDPSVAEALQAMAALLRPDHVISAAGDETDFPASVAAVFSPEPAAAMVMAGDFAPGVVADSTTATVGVDVDVFPFPGAAASDRFVVAGGDAAVLLTADRPARELLGYLASAEAATIWAEQGGFLSPNEEVELTAYPDATTQRIARSVLESAEGLRFDLSDQQPAEFGSTPGRGLAAELSRFIADPSDVRATMTRLEEAAAQAWSG